MARCTRALLAAALLIGAAPQTAGARPLLPPARMAELSRYEVLLQSDPAGAGLQRHRVVGLFDATPEDIFRVATSYERYAEYMPRLTTSHTLGHHDGGTVVALEADLPWPLQDTWVHARFQHDQPEGGSYRVRFSMVRGNLHRYEGSLLIEPAGPRQSYVTYELVAQPESRLPRTWVQNAVGRGALNFVHCLRSRVSGLVSRGLLQGAAGAALYPMLLKGHGDEAPDDASGDE